MGTGLTLVTGATGFLGRRVITRLRELNQPFRAVMRPGARLTSELNEQLTGRDSRGELAECSLNDQAGLDRVLDGVDVVLHLAASKSGSAPAQIANTVVTSEHLFQSAVRARTPRVVLVSSFGVIGAGQVPTGGLLDESVPMEPHPEWRDPYSFAKHKQESLAWRYSREHGLRLVVLRPGSIFGPGQNILTSRIGVNLFGLFLHLGRGATLPLTYVQNCADAIVQAGTAPDAEGEVFCIVDDDLPTSRQLLRRYRREIARIPFVPVPSFALQQLAVLNAWYSRRTGNHLPPVFTPYKVSNMWRGLRFSNEKAKRVLKWTPRVPMADALRITFEAERHVGQSG